MLFLTKEACLRKTHNQWIVVGQTQDVAMWLLGCSWWLLIGPGQKSPSFLDATHHFALCKCIIGLFFILFIFSSVLSFTR